MTAPDTQPCPECGDGRLPETGRGEEGYVVVKTLACATKGEASQTECRERERNGTGCWGCLGNGRQAILANPIAVRPVNVANVARLWREGGEI